MTPDEFMISQVVRVWKLLAAVNCGQWSIRQMEIFWIIQIVKSCNDGTEKKNSIRQGKRAFSFLFSYVIFATLFSIRLNAEAPSSDGIHHPPFKPKYLWRKKHAMSNNKIESQHQPTYLVHSAQLGTLCWNNNK